jgi:hypothetical protein
MASNIKFFIGGLIVRVGEYENTVRLLVVANSEARAAVTLDRAAASYYGNGDEPLELGGYFANDAQVHVSVLSLHEVGLAAFLELSPILSVHRDSNIPADLSADALTSEGFKGFAASVSKNLGTQGHNVGNSILLAALAKALGERNWAVLRAKLCSPAVSEAEQETVCPKRDTLTPKVAVLCRDANGEPVFYKATPTVTAAQLEEGQHYELAIEEATADGYENAHLAFDKSDRAARELRDLTTWFN